MVALHQAHILRPAVVAAILVIAPAREEPPATLASSKVVLQRDFVDAVTSPSPGRVPAEVTIDGDNRTRIWTSPGGGGGGGSGNTYFPGGWI